jgi:hypothetical protein
MAHHRLQPKVVDVGFKAHELGRHSKVFVDEGSASVGDNGLGDEAPILVIDNGGDSHKIYFVGKEGSNVNVDDEDSEH